MPGVVGTLMTNMAVELALRQRDIPLVRAKVGDRYVLEELSARGWHLGGEGSGHLLVLNCHTTGDGIVSALQVMQALQRSGKSLSALLHDVTLFPQTLLNVRLPEGSDWRSNTTLAAAQQAVDAELGESGRVLIRASGTEPVLRIMVEARDADCRPQGGRTPGCRSRGLTAWPSWGRCSSVQRQQFAPCDSRVTVSDSVMPAVMKTSWRRPRVLLSKQPLRKVTPC